MQNKIKVLIVDDSIVFQKKLERILSQSSIFEICAIASNGLQAIKMAELYKPDIISMDIMMPIMDGITTATEIMQTNPIPIVFVSDIYNIYSDRKDDLSSGAVSFIAKPSGVGKQEFDKFASKYLNLLRIMSEIKVVKRPKNSKEIPNDNSDNTITAQNYSFDIIAIGASAGGPESIKNLLTTLGNSVNIPIIVVQHIDPNFSESYANWLNNHSPLNVQIAKNNQIASAGGVYIAPGGSHMIITENYQIKLVDDKNGSLHIPSIDNLKNRGIGIILSGMGRDGAIGIKSIYDKKGVTFAQDKESCLVYGMPSEAIRLNGITQVMNPENIGKRVLEILSK
jgi:two-component system chemotaxis response regulator CheB